MNKLRLVKPFLSLLAALAGMGGCTVSLAAEVTVFGLPLGGQLRPDPKECTVKEITSNGSKAPCWIGKPFVSKTSGGKLGSLQMPSPDTLPEWAASASFKAEVTKQGILELLTLEALDGKLKHTIASSISKRFGLPVETTLPRTEWAEAKWHGEGIEVFQRCTVKSCEVRFLSPAAIEKMAGTQAEAQRIKASRPATP